MHFRNNTLLDMLNIYACLTTQWNHDYKRCALFEDGILSYVLLSVPANDAQYFSQGLYYLQNKSKKFSPMLALRDGGKNFYLACRAPSADFSSMTGSCVDIWYGAPQMEPRSGGVRRADFAARRTHHRVAEVAALCKNYFK